MILALLSGRAIGEERERLRRVLRAGPWCWPEESDKAAFTSAQRFSDLPAPPESLPGACLGVSVAEGTTRATLWLLNSEDEFPADAALHGSARASWHTATLAIPRALPVVWTSLRKAGANEPRLTCIDTWCEAGWAQPEEVVKGSSFGLSFALIAASRLTGLRIAGDIAMSVGVGPNGALASVGSLRLKLRAITEFAPRVRRFIVADSQMDEARGLAGDRLEIVPAGKLGGAIELAFGAQALGRALADAVHVPTSRTEVINAFFALVLQGRSELVDWTPVARGAEVALECEDLTDDQRYQLEFVRAVATRHDVNAGDLSLPPEAWLASLPPPLQCQVAANTVQHVADTGTPDEAGARALADRFRATSVGAAFGPQLAIEGALARLDASTGNLAAALQTQRRLANAFLDSFSPQEVSYQLSEIYRLAGVTGDHAAFDEANTIDSRVQRAGGYGLAGCNDYVSLARARAMVLLQRPCGNEPVATLRALAANESIPPHVRWSAARWLRRCVPGGDDPLMREPPTGIDESHRHSFDTQSALARLDDGIASGDVPAQERAIEDLRRLEPAIMRGIEREGRGPELAARVARLYPY
jgi:hypothetical protein